MFIMFLAEYDLPFSLCDDMMDLLKKMFPDSRIAAEMSLGRKKTAASVHILELIRGKLIRRPRRSKFSLIIDESTDCSTSKTCAILARYFDFDDNCCKTEMLDMINIYAGNTGGLFWGKLIQHPHKLPAIFGNACKEHGWFCSINSVTSSLKQLPGITLMKYGCTVFIYVQVRQQKHFHVRAKTWLQIFTIILPTVLKGNMRLKNTKCFVI